jgi:hypothetical protein
MTNEEETLKQLNRSGFPFQLRIEQEIQSTKSQHRWQVATREHPWPKSNHDSSGFIDLVLRHEEFKGDRLVIECKRIKGDDARQLQWLFLLPDDPTITETKRVSCLEVKGGPPTKADHRGWRDHRIWEDLQVDPPSYQSEFCVLSGDDPKRQPILESLCANLLESLDGLAGEEINIGRSQKLKTDPIFIFPAVVKNTKITVYQFKENDVKITDGTLDLSAVTLTDVPFIRFRKSLVTNFPEGKFRDLKKANMARERTVFILVLLLTEWVISA